MTLNKLSAAILLCAILAVTLPYQLSVKADPDLWWHTRTGLMILEKGSIPDTDLFSFTAYGKTWINHEWLSDVIFAIAWHIAKDKGLLLLRIGLLTGLSLCLTITFINRWPNELIALITLALILPVMSIFVNVRPHSFTYMLTVVTICLWDAWLSKKKYLIWILPVLMVCWVNLHGGFLLGLAISSLFTISIFLGWEGLPTRPSRKDQLQLLTVMALTILATLATPWGFELYSYLAKELGGSHSNITEWQRVNTDQQIFFLGYSLVPIVLYLFARRWNRVAIPVLFVISACNAWVHVRFMVVMVIFGSVMAMDAAGELFRNFFLSRRWLKNFDRMRHPLYLLIFIGIFVLAFSPLQIWHKEKRGDLRLRASEDLMPMHAVSFLKKRQLGPNLALLFKWSGFAIWHLYPQYKVAIDGRNLTVYEGSWVDGYLQSYNSGTLTDYLSEHFVDVILVESGDMMDKALSDNSKWIEGYRDWQAVVYLPAEKFSYPRIEGPVRPTGETFFFPGDV